MPIKYVTILLEIVIHAMNEEMIGTTRFVKVEMFMTSPEPSIKPTIATEALTHRVNRLRMCGINLLI